jgi:hypothetical protein
VEIGASAYSEGCVGYSNHGVGGGGLVGHTKSGGTGTRHGDGDLTSTTTRCGVGSGSASLCYPGYWCPPAVRDHILHSARSSSSTPLPHL